MSKNQINDSVIVDRGQVIDSEGLLHAAMGEIEVAVMFGRTRGNATAKHILLNVVALRKRVEALISDCYYTNRPYPDAYKCMTLLREACHWSEAARQNYKHS